MASGIYAEVKKRIELAEPGTVFLTSDFTDIATTTTVRKCLGRQVEEKIIRRIMDGVYEKPIYSKLLKEYIPANPDAIACAIASVYLFQHFQCRGDLPAYPAQRPFQRVRLWVCRQKFSLDHCSMRRCCIK